MIYNNSYDYKTLDNIVIDDKKYNNDEIKIFINDNFHIEQQQNNLKKFLDFQENEKVILYHHIDYRENYIYYGYEKIVLTNYGKILSIFCKKIEKETPYYYNVVLEHKFWIPIEYIKLLNQIKKEKIFISEYCMNYSTMLFTEKICNILSSIKELSNNTKTNPIYLKNAKVKLD